MNTESSKGIRMAEASLPTPAPVAERRRRSHRPALVVLFAVLLAAAAARLILWSTAVIEPSYEMAAPDSESIMAGAVMLEERVRETGSFPDGLEERLRSNPEISLTVNQDGSFTYSEGGVSFRSAPGIIRRTGAPE
jgi:hypothetical protein